MAERLIVGLGNPGKDYVRTRHNIGFEVVEQFASAHGFAFRKEARVQGMLAQGLLGQEKVFLLLPQTYMNQSGISVQACLSYYGISLGGLCVVCDDIHLPLGTLRMRAEGGSGGHNGLKSITAHVGTQLYPRLRIGIGDKQQGDLSDHVLGVFSAQEQQELSRIEKEAVAALESWLQEGIARTMELVNRVKKNEEKQ